MTYLKFGSTSTSRLTTAVVDLGEQPPLPPTPHYFGWKNKSQKEEKPAVQAKKKAFKIFAYATMLLV